MAGSLGCGPLLGKPLIQQAFPFFGQCAGLISSFSIPVRCTAEAVGLPILSAAQDLLGPLRAC